MAAEPIFTPEFVDDLTSAADWYDHQGAGLGRKFLESIDACITSIAKMPTMHEKVKKNYRRALPHGFPYAVFYEFVDSRLTFYAVIHTARHSDAWQKRLL